MVFSRNDSVLAFGKLWRIDHIDGSWVSISNDDNEQKTVSVNIPCTCKQCTGHRHG